MRQQRRRCRAASSRWHKGDACLAGNHRHPHQRLSYDYFKLAEDKSIGLERTATLIAAARKEFPNTVLLDDGDTIQGAALADYQAQVSPVDCKTTLAIYKVMNSLKYDAGTIGNHEFNYGLPFLGQVTGTKLDVPNMPPVAQQSTCSGPGFPLVLANVLGAKSSQPIFKPYTIVTRNLTATTTDGKQVTAPVKSAVSVLRPRPSWRGTSGIWTETSLHRDSRRRRKSMSRKCALKVRRLLSRCLTGDSTRRRILHRWKTAATICPRYRALTH